MLRVLLAAAPDVAVLQEVTDVLFYSALRPVLGHAGYRAWPPQGPKQSYDAMIFSKLPIKNARRETLPRTMMGRDLLSADIGGVRVMTAHMESTRSGASARRLQLAAVMAAMDSHDGPCVFGGDTNLRAAEVTDDARARDAWRLAGEPDEHKFTWDLVRNRNKVMPGGRRPRTRYDRVFVEGLRVEGFSLVGTAPLQGGGLWPSDHFGIAVTLSPKQSL